MTNKHIVHARGATTEDREKMVLEILGVLEGMSDKEVARRLAEMRYQRERLRIIQMLEGPFGEIVEILQAECGYDSERDRANFANTPSRAASALFEQVETRWIKEQGLMFHLDTRFPGHREEIMASSDGGVYNSMVVSANNVVWGMCPHHLLAIRYVIHMAYLPDRLIDDDDPDELDAELLGLSKLPRVALAVGSQPILHEDVGELIADVLHAPRLDDDEDGENEDEDDDGEDDEETEESYWQRLRVKSAGAAVIVDAFHTCVCARGVRMDSSRTGAMALRGDFMPDENGAVLRDEFLAHVARLRGDS